jgi:hypothetical protein
MKIVYGLICLLLLLVNNVCASEVTGNINLMYGEKFLDPVTWATLDHQKEFGVLFDIREEMWPVSLAFELFSSEEEHEDQSCGKTKEYCIGLKKIWGFRNDSICPFVAGGLAYIQAEKRKILIVSNVNSTNFTQIGNPYENLEYMSFQDDGAGYWISCGVYVTLWQRVNVGALTRYSHAKIDSYDGDVNAGGNHVVFFMGYHW